MADRTPARDRIFSSLLALLVASGVPAVTPARADGVDNSGASMPTIRNYKTPEEAVAAMTTNLTAEAAKMKAEGFKSTYIGGSELRRKLDEVLAEKGQHSVFILGPRGAGKTVAVETMAGDIEGKTIYSLNIGNLSGGTEYRGTLEERVRLLLEFFVGHPERILFIDEIHSFLKLEGVADLLKPAMGSKKLTLIGASTEDEYRDFIEENPPLIDRTTTETIPEFNVETAIDVLRSNANRIEENTGFKISDEAIERAVKMSFMYYSDRSPSRTPIRLLERAAMRKKFDLRADKEPFELLKYNDIVQKAQLAITRLQAEIEQRKEKTDVGRLEAKLEKAQYQLQEAISDRAEVEQFYIQPRLIHRKAELEAHNEEFLKAHRVKPVKKDDPRWIEFQEFSAELKDIDAVLTELGPAPNYDSKWIEANDVGRIVAGDMGFTNQAANESEIEKLARVRKGLEENFFGNPHVIEGIMRALEERILHVDRATGPIGVFGLFGAKGRGKTTVEEVLAKIYYGDPSRVVRISMNAIKGLGTAALWGHERGIVDSEKGGMLDTLRRRQHSLLNLDEVEKGANAYGQHENLDSFHQAFDKGFQFDARNRKIPFFHTLVLLTGNLLTYWSEVREFYSAEELEKAFGLEPGTFQGKDIYEMDQIMLQRAVIEAGFSESIVDRISAMFVLNSVSRDSAKSVLRKALREQAEEFYEYHNVRLDFGDLSKNGTGSLADAIVDHYYNANHSARYYHRLRKTLINPRITAIVKDVLAKSNSGKFPADSFIEFKWVANPGKTSDKAAMENNAILSGQVEVSLKRTITDANGVKTVETLDRFSRQDESLGRERPMLDMSMYIETVDRPELRTVGRAAGEAGRAIDPKTDEMRPETEGRDRAERMPRYGRTSRAMRRRGPGKY